MDAVIKYFVKVADKLFVGALAGGVATLVALCYTNILANWKQIYWQIPTVSLVIIFFLAYWLFSCSPNVFSWAALVSSAVFAALVTIILLSATPPGNNWYSNFAFVFGLIAFFCGSAIALAAKKALLLHNISDSRKLGFAVTGVTYLGDSKDNLQFVFIFNKNVREGKGLWLPPGGRYFPAFEHPEEKLRAKILDELGQPVDIEPPSHRSMPSEIADQITATVRWYQPPFFILREDLQGTSSYGHTEHFDLIYLCRLQASAKRTKSLYTAEQRLEVPVKECALSYDATFSACSREVSADSHRRTGRSTHAFDTLSTDLIWRLHLAAIYLMGKPTL